MRVCVTRWNVCVCAFVFLCNLCVCVQALDAQGLTSTFLFTIAVLYVNKPPVMGNVTYSVAQSVGVVGYSFSPPLNAQDPQSLPLQYFLTNVSDEAVFTLDPALGVLTIVSTPPPYSVLAVHFNDTLGLVGTSWVTVTIVPPGTPSLLGIGLPPSGVVNTNGTSSVTLLGSNFQANAAFAANYTSGPLTLQAACVYSDENTLNCTTSPVILLCVCLCVCVCVCVRLYALVGASVRPCGCECDCLCLCDAQGYGAGFAWRLWQNGIEVQRPTGVGPLLMSYSPPLALVPSVTANIATNPATPTTLTINGLQLYTDCSVVTVTAGPWVWTPITCTYSSILVQTLAGGGGKGLTVNVSVGGNWAVASPTVSYQPPVITSLVGGRLPTYGNGSVSIQGTGYGPAAAPLAVTYGGGSDGRTYNASCVRTASSNPALDALACAAAPGVGTAHVWTVCVSNQCSALSVNTTSYVGPTITSITGMLPL